MNFTLSQLGLIDAPADKARAKEFEVVKACLDKPLSIEHLELIARLLPQLAKLTSGEYPGVHGFHVDLGSRIEKIQIRIKPDG